MSGTIYSWKVEYAKSGRSKCQLTKEPIANGAMRIGMEVASTFKEGSTMFLWSNVDALFESFRKGSATQNRVTSLDQLAGHDALRDEDQETLERLIGEQGDLLETLAEADKDTTRLECTAGGESKFWSVAVAGNLTRVRWGAIGDEGNISEKQHGDDDTAAKFAEKKIKEKLKKGYEQIDGTKKRKQDTGKDAGATPDAGAAKPKKAKTAKKAPAKKAPAKAAKVAKAEGKAAPAAAKDGEVIHSWAVEYAKSGRSKCQVTNEVIPAGSVRIGKEVDNPWKAGTTMFVWHDPKALFESFHKGKASKPKIKDLSDIKGYDGLKQEDKETIEELVGTEQDFQAELEEADTSATYLECTSNGESKWWSISAQGCNTRVRWGAVGEEGSVSEKEHKDEAAADKFMAKMLGQKLKKGYVQK